MPPAARWRARASHERGGLVARGQRGGGYRVCLHVDDGALVALGACAAVCMHSCTGAPHPTRRALLAPRVGTSAYTTIPSRAQLQAYAGGHSGILISNTSVSIAKSPINDLRIPASRPHRPRLRK